MTVAITERGAVMSALVVTIDPETQPDLAAAADEAALRADGLAPVDRRDAPGRKTRVFNSA